MPKLRVRLVSPWNRFIETETAIFSADFPTSTADALLSEWEPSEELLAFQGRKAWYCCEPQCCFTKLQGGMWPGVKQQLAEHEFLFHGHHNPALRVPHITHFERLVMADEGARKRRAIAIVSNQGGSAFTRHPEMTLRNEVIIGPNVDLFGRSAWKRFRRRWYSLPAAPTNYCGELPGEWHGTFKRDLQATYQVAVCMENMREFLYFTEKFVEAVVAGCIPVYAAHESLISTYLEGAFWVDPGTYGKQPWDAVEASLHSDYIKAMTQNQNWLKENSHLRESRSVNVFERIGKILAQV